MALQTCMFCATFMVLVSSHFSLAAPNVASNTNAGPTYSLNHTSLGCPASLPCKCEVVQNGDASEKIINCTHRNLEKVPVFLELTGYKFDRVLLSNNNIKSLTKNAFQGLDVRVIDLNNNSLSSVSDNAFNHVQGVEELHMENGNLHTAPISLQYIPSLRQLHMRNQEIRYLTKTAFNNLIDLEILDLSKNPVQFASPFDAFDKLEKLKILKLADCSLPNLPLVVMEKIEALEILDIKNNNITYIPADVFANFPNIRELDLEGNSITLEHFKEFKSLRRLKILKLGHCRIKELNATMMLSIPQVHTLVIRHCHVHKIYHGTFRNLFHLSKLDLSGNPKVKINDKLFHGLEERLRILGIENMNLSSFPTGAFRKLFVLKKIKANRNSIRHLPKRVFHGLKGHHLEVHLEKNEIFNISSHFLHGAKTPLKVHLQHNDISSVDFIVNNPCNLYNTEIRLDNNPIVCDCNLAVVLQKKAFNLTGTCQSGDDKMVGLRLAPPFGEPPDERYVETTAIDECPNMAVNKTDERYDCACDEWMPFNSTKVCAGQSNLAVSRGTLLVASWFSLFSLIRFGN